MRLARSPLPQRQGRHRDRRRTHPSGLGALSAPGARRRPPDRGTVCVTVTHVESRVVRARLDDVSERALSALMREGRNESEAVRLALTEAGRRRARRSALAVEVARLADDERDATERMAVMAD